MIASVHRTSKRWLFLKRIVLSLMQVDIVSMDLSQRISFPFRNKTVGIAIQRGIMFEISYSASLKGISLLFSFTIV